MIFVRCVTTFHSKMKLKATLCLYSHLQIDRWGGDVMKVKYVSPSGTGFFMIFFLLCCIWTNINLNCIQLYALKVAGTIMVRPGMQGKQVLLLFFCDLLFIGFWLKTVFKCGSRKTIIFEKKKCFTSAFLFSYDKVLYASKTLISYIYQQILICCRKSDANQ